MTALRDYWDGGQAPATIDLHEADDSELAERSRVDAEAFGVLYARYSRQIYRMVYHRVGDASDAEDVTAEVFAKAFRAIDGYRPARAPFWGWLHRIASNAVVDHFRARRPTSPLTAVTDSPDISADVEAEVVGRLEAMRAWRAVAGLCPTQRTALTLRLAHDLPIAVIAVHMERSEGAVKQLINRGLTAVRDRLAEDRAESPNPGRGRTRSQPASDASARGRHAR